MGTYGICDGVNEAICAGVKSTNCAVVRTPSWSVVKPGIAADWNSGIHGAGISCSCNAVRAATSADV